MTARANLLHNPTRFWAAAALLCLVLAGLLTAAVTAGATQSFDVAAYEWCQSLRTETGDRFVEQLTGLGDVVTLTIATVAFYLLLRFVLNRRCLGFVMLSVVGGRLLHVGLRLAVGRTRPNPAVTLFPVDTTGYPSGHTMMSLVVYGTFALLFTEQVPNAAVRRGFFAAALMISAALGVTRLFLGVHYVTDVVAGWLFGLSFVAGCWAARTALEARKSSA